MLSRALLGKRIKAFKWDDLELYLAVEDDGGGISIIRFWVDGDENYYTKLEAEVQYPVDKSQGWRIYNPEQDGTENEGSGKKE